MRRELCARRPNLKSQFVISNACALLRSIEKENRRENVQRCAGQPGLARGLRRRKVLPDRCSASHAGCGENRFFARWKWARLRWIYAWPLMVQSWSCGLVGNLKQPLL